MPSLLSALPSTRASTSIGTVKFVKPPGIEYLVPNLRYNKYQMKSGVSVDSPGHGAMRHYGVVHEVGCGEVNNLGRGEAVRGLVLDPGSLGGEQKAVRVAANEMC